jgi:hypothetical protein
VGSDDEGISDEEIERLRRLIAQRSAERRQEMRAGIYSKAADGWIIGNIIGLPIVVVLLVGHFQGWWS